MNPEKTVSIHPYFKVNDGEMENFINSLSAFVEKTQSEPACLYYDFTVNGNIVFCREAYVGAEGALTHLDNVGSMLQEALQRAELIRLEIHGAEAELAKMKEPLADLNPDWFQFQCGVTK